MSTLESWLLIALSAGIGPRTFRKLLTIFGSPERILAAGRSELKAQGLSPQVIESLDAADPNHLKPVLAWLQQAGHFVITLADNAYPALLQQIPDAPPVLYVAGRLPVLNQPSIAVVGSRNATPLGLQTSYDFSYTLAKLGLVVVSGLARGIDCQAHLGAMDAESAGTIAVMATGHARVYPAQHHGLYRRIVDCGGAVISELSHHEKLSARQFPRRNRIISGLSLGTLVVEASMRSGSLLTARHALDQGREVFAVPGSIHSTVSKGCNHLIKQGACLVEVASDILYELPLNTYIVPADACDLPHGTRIPEDLSAECRQVVQTLGASALCIDQLTTKSGLTTGQVSSILVQLEIKGLVYQSGMGHYVSSAAQKPS